MISTEISSETKHDIIKPICAVNGVSLTNLYQLKLKKYVIYSKLLLTN